MDRQEKIEGRDEWYASSSYERLLLLQPQIRLGGLQKLDHAFYVVCPDLNAGLVTHNGEPLVTWFDQEIRPAGSPIRIVDSAPPGSHSVALRSPIDLAMLRGEPLTVHDVYIQMAILLPRSFPDFWFGTNPPIATFTVARELTQEETRILQRTFEPFKWGSDVRLEVVVDTKLNYRR